MPLSPLSSTASMPPGKADASTLLRAAAPRRRLLRATLALAGSAGLMALSACDQLAQSKLVAGQHTEQDVRSIMGAPTLVWEVQGGARQLDYVRGPQGFETWRVDISADGRYQGMKQLLTVANFKSLAQVGMTEAQLVRLFSRPAERQPYALKKEVWLIWRFEESGSVRRNFNAHFQDGIDRAVEFSFTDDKTMYPGASLSPSAAPQA
ncbi:MAG: hypothetical protein NTV17_06465 [Burkholderiales bacterium]|nr:hypothetical protein [Burkholderiales bacterium]